MTEKLTAAQHFAKAEELLAHAEEYRNDPKVASWAARAAAHIAAAEFLLKLHTLAYSTDPRALKAAGLKDVEDSRDTTTQDRGQ